MSASMIDTAAPAPAPARPVRPFYWSVRRETWENRGVYLAPLAVAGVVIAAFTFALRFLPNQIRQAEALAAQLKPIVGSPTAAVALERVALHNAEAAVVFPFAAGPGAVVMTAIVFAIFYALASLHGERRDRSILFWKSLPVSDLTTVLSKATLALVVLPVAASLVALATLALMLGLATAVLGASGLDPSLLWQRLDVLWISISIPYGLVALALWQAPVIGWLMLVSAWAKRMTVLWALAPPAAICLFERLALGTTHAWDFLRHRLAIGFSVGFTTIAGHSSAVMGLERPDPAHLLANPGLWGGLVVTAALLGACVWLRRTRDPI
jgi:ABC-2 type transport system permease protein